MHYNDIPCLVDEETRSEVFDYVANQATNEMVFVEVGCFLGGSVGRLAAKIKERNVQCQIYCVDKWICDDVSKESKIFCKVYDNFYDEFIFNMKEVGVIDLIKCLKMDSIEASKEFKDKTIDFIFIDGCHSYPYTKLELQAWLPKMKDNSIICGHDYPAHPIWQAVKDVIGLEKVYPVTNNGSYVYKIGSGM